MSITIVQQASNNTASGTTCAVTLWSSVTAGNTLVVLVSSFLSSLGTQTASASDAQSDSFVNGISISGGSSGALFAAAINAYNVAGGATTVTVTVTQPGAIEVVVLEITPPNSSTPDASNSSSGTSTSPTSGSLVLTSGDFVVGVMTNALTIGSTTGPSNLYLSTSGSPQGAMGYNTLGPGTISLNWSMGMSNDWVAIGIAYKPSTAVISPPPPAHSQRWDVLLDFNSWWEQSRLQPTPLTFLLTPFPQQRSQRIEPLFDYWQEWEAYTTHQPQPITFLPTPFPPQCSQRIEPLPDYWQEWTAFAAHSILPATYLPTPFPPQCSQIIVTLIDYWQEWEAYNRLWPLPVQFIPPPPPTRQPDQRWDNQPDFSQLWWEQYQFHLVPLPSTFFVSQEGVYGVYNLYSGASQVGGYRVQGNIERYNVYIGAGVLPDLTQIAAAFSQNLPISVTITPPATGTLTFYVLVRKEDSYGLQSQNSFFTTITIDHNGNIVMPPIAVPQNLKLVQQTGDNVRVLAVYPTQATDLYPADTWRVWTGATPPNPLVDPPILIVPVSGNILAAQIGPYSPGVLYVAVALYRSADAFQSPALVGSITLSTAPAEVIAIPSGFDSV